MFLAELRASGKDPAPLIKKYGFPPNIEQLAVIDFPLSRFRTFAEDVARAAGPGALGVRTALGVPRGRYGLFEFLARSSTTIGDAVRALVEYGTVLHPIARYTLDVTSAQAFLAIRFPDDPLGWGRHGNEYTLVLFTELVRNLSGRAFAPRRVWFNNEAPKDTRALESALGGAAMEFGAGDLGMLFDAEILAWPTVSADAPLNRVLKAQAQKTKQEAPVSDDFVEQVGAAIRSVLETGHTGIEDVAKRLHLGERTLQRRLEASGTTFSDLLDQTRLARSRVLLAQPGSLSEVAFKVGYSDVRAFSRAFRSWAGKSPAQYRASMK